MDECSNFGETREIWLASKYLITPGFPLVFNKAYDVTKVFLRMSGSHGLEHK